MIYFKMKSRLYSFVVAIVASACSSMPINDTVVKNEYASVSFKYANTSSNGLSPIRLVNTPSFMVIAPYHLNTIQNYMPSFSVI